MNRVAITGLAVMSPFGGALDELWQGLCHGPARTGRFVDPALHDFHFPVALLPDGAVPRAAPAPIRAARLAHDLITRALASAGLAAPPGGAALGLGAHWGETDYLTLPPTTPPPSLLADLVSTHGFTGPAVATPAACASGNLALAWAADRIADGDAPLAVAGGLDVVGPTQAGVFELFGNLTETAPKPFDADRDGFMLGEGGALLVLEPEASARKAGRRVLGWLRATGAAHDATHSTRSARDGRGIIRAVRRTLLEGEVTPNQIGWVNAHSPGTAINDFGEANAYLEVFGPRGVPVSSTKAVLGHAQGGANGLEAAACLLALAHQTIPPTHNVVEVDRRFHDLDLVIAAPRQAKLELALSTASGMGGANAVALFERGDPWV